MFDQFQTLLTSAAALLCGFSAGATWVAVVAVPNEAFDHMDHTRADRHVRYVVQSCSTLVAGVLLASAAMCVLGGAYGAATLSGIAALGFFSNRWTLSRRKSRTAPPGTRRRLKSQRVVAVSMSLIFGLTAGVAGILATVEI